MTKEAKEVDPNEAALVKEWNERIDVAKQRWQPDFERMRTNMRFATGRQWPKQKELQDERYVCNLTLKQIRQKVATLYAKNPKAEAVRRERMDYQLWDEDADSLVAAMQTKQMAAQVGVVDMEAEAILNDFMMGQKIKTLVKKVCKTLDILYQYQVDHATPNFKRQMKRLVTRVVTCGVGYIRVSFVRNEESPISTDNVPSSPLDRMKFAATLAEEIKEDGLETETSKVETLKMLGASIGKDTAYNPEVTEKIEFDALPATSVIPDTSCRSLQDFVGARWVCVEYELPLDEINSIFGTDEERDNNQLESKEKGSNVNKATKTYTVREVLDYRTRCHFFILKGKNSLLRAPEPLTPNIKGFWPVFALTFNDIEVGADDEEGEVPVSIFPPSDVDLILHPQKEWNRSRDGERDLRNACAPKWMCRKGTLSKEDLEKIQNAEPNEVVELESVNADAKLDEILAPIPVQVPDQRVFGTEHLIQDITLGGGMQEANMGAAPSNVTATGVSVAEQSRMTVSASNIDDLDEFLSAIASAAGEMALSPEGFSENTVKRIVGQGAVWPGEDRADFQNQIYLTIKAGSSGRPNKAIEVSNYQLIAPQLLNAGANPLGVIKEGVRRLDDGLDMVDFMPTGGLGGPSALAPAVGPGAPGQKQKLLNGAPATVG